MADFNDLLEGYHRFRKNGWSGQRDRWAKLAEGQNPRILVIACSDSRTDPATVFDTAPGEIFAVRNIANLVPPFEVGGGRHGVSAALEFAVSVLEVDDILVLGHGRCGGCHAALTRSFEGARPDEGGFLAHWIDVLDEARDKVLAEYGDAPLERPAFLAMEHESVKVSLNNLRTFPSIRQREAEGRLKLRGGFFAIADGELHLLDEKTGTFSPA